MVPIGFLVTLLGFAVAVSGLGLTASLGGRLSLVLLGIAVSLFGIVGCVNRAYLRHAIWKS